MKNSALLLVVLLAFASCQSDEINEAPVVTNKLQDAEIVSGLNSISLSLANTFSDPDGDALTYQALSSNENVVEVSIRGSLLVATKVASGSADITVTAIDPMENKSSDYFTIEVQ